VTPERPVLRYFGGKWLLAPWIIENLPPHRVYVEPFGGAASVLMRKPRSYAEVYNDLDSEVVSLFRVLRDPIQAQELEHILRLTPFARDEFDLAYMPAYTEAEKARRLIIRAFMGFGSDGHNAENGKTGFRANSNRAGTTPAHDWANYPKQIEAFCDRLAGVVIENRDAFEIMAQQDSEQTLHFVDPPYVHETRGRKNCYKFEMDNAAHERLLDFLNYQIKGMVVLCGYDNALYAARLNWERRERRAMADGARERTEVLWLNPAAVKAASQQSLFEVRA
jgi:DNA adenine methylase